MRFSEPESDWRNTGIWSIDRSSSGVPNSAMAVFARSAGSPIPRSPLAVAWRASWAPAPPVATLRDISSASSPMALYASVDASDMSEPRMVNSLRASPVLSRENLPLSAAMTRALKACSPENPRAVKLTPYSWRISGSSSRMAAGTFWYAAVRRSNPCVPSLTRPLLMSWETVWTDSDTSVPNVLEKFMAVSVSPRRDPVPSAWRFLNEDATIPTLSDTSSIDSPNAPRYTSAVTLPYWAAVSLPSPREAASLSLMTSVSMLAWSPVTMAAPMAAPPRAAALKSPTRSLTLAPSAPSAPPLSSAASATSSVALAASRSESVSCSAARRAWSVAAREFMRALRRFSSARSHRDPPVIPLSRSSWSWASAIPTLADAWISASRALATLSAEARTLAAACSTPPAIASPAIWPARWPARWKGRPI